MVKHSPKVHSSEERATTTHKVENFLSRQVPFEVSDWDGGGEKESQICCSCTSFLSFFLKG